MRVLRNSRLNEWLAEKDGYKALLEARAVELFRNEPMKCLRGEHCVSAETDAPLNRPLAIANMIIDSRETFLRLISGLQPAYQDILIQYYFLGRTQTQIGNLLKCSQTTVWQRLDTAILGMCIEIMNSKKEALTDKRLVNAKKRLTKKLNSPTGRIVKRTIFDTFSPPIKDLKKVLAPSTTDSSVFQESRA